MDAATDLNIIERKGSWYAYKGNNLAQGRQNVVDLLKQDSDLASVIETEVRLALSDFVPPTATADTVVPEHSNSVADDDDDDMIGSPIVGMEDEIFQDTDLYVE